MDETPSLRRIQRALQDSETRLQQVLDNTSAIVFAKDGAGRYLFVNRGFEKLVDRPSTAILGLTDEEMFAPGLATRFRYNDLRVLHEKRAIEFEEAGEFGGVNRTFLSSKFPLLDSSGEVYAVCGIATDITERKRFEEALKSAALAVSESEGVTLYRSLVRYLATTLGLDGAFIATCDPEDPSRLRMLAFHLDGMTMENFDYAKAGTPCETVVGQGFRCYASGLIERFPLDEDFRRLGFESYAGHPLADESGRSLGLISVVCRRPLTDAAFVESVLRIFAVRVNAELERVAAEERRLGLESQLRQAQKMEAIGQLTGGIAHDFNNLLTGIMGYVTLASDREAAMNDPRLAGYLAQAQRSCERARDLIQQMLMFSRGQRGSPQRLALGPLVEQVLESLRPTIPASLRLASEVASDLPPVRADPLQVEQVLLNLCLNARDAVDGAGTIRVGARSVVADGLVCTGCRAGAEGACVELWVEDDGQGIAPGVLERVFEPFFSTKETGKGTGMGLAMVHGIVHEHGGHVVVETESGRGSRFRVLWPALHEDAARAADGPPRGTARFRGPRPGLRGSVLVVDDEVTVGEFMRELLGTWGLEATFVANPQAALDLVSSRRKPFDLVITDQVMPHMSGLQLARALHATHPDVPVVLYTGYGEGVGPADLEPAGVRAVLSKPVDPARLETVLAETLAGPETPLSGGRAEGTA